MRIPEIRERLFQLAVDLDCAELAELAHATYRRRCPDPAPRKHRPLTARQCADIVRLKAQNPRMHRSEIAAIAGTNPGRVSEILTGKRQ